MVRIKQFFKNMKKDVIPKMSVWIISILLLQLLVVLLLTTELKKEMINREFQSSFNVIEVGITEYSKRQENELKHMIKEILDQVHFEYKDNNDKLKEDINSLDKNSKFVSIINSITYNKENVLLFSMDKVLMGNYNSYNMNSIKNKNFFNISIDEFYSHFNNSQLVKNTFDDIFSLKPLNEHILLGIEKNTSNLNIEKFDLEEIFKILINDPDKINDFYFISVAYITESGDIFNVADYDIIGNPVKNNKLILVKLFSFNDIDNSIVLNELSSLNKEIKNIELISDMVEGFFTYLTIITILSCSVLILTINIVHDKEK